MQTLSPSTDQAIPSPASSSARKSLAEKHFFKFLLILMLIAAIAYTSVSYTRFKFARSEIAYAEISKEMLANNSFIVPLYHGVACIDKPVLNYWAIIPSFKLFGVSEFSARIPAILASLLCLLIFALSIRRIWGSDVSLLSTMVLASSQRYWEFATLCMTDMFLTLFDSVSLIALFVGLKNEKLRLRCFVIAAVSMGLAVLTKGPVGLILPAFSFFLYLVFTRSLKVLNVVQIAICAVIFFAVAAPWYVTAASAVNTNASVGAWLWHHNVERFFGSAYEFHNNPTYMLEALFNGFAPWCIFLPFALVASIVRWFKKTDIEESKTELYLWTWLILTTTFFTLSRGKMNYYDLPAFPAAAGIIGLHLHHWFGNKSKIGTIVGWLFAAALLIGSFVSGFLLPSMCATEDFAAWCAMPIGLLLCGAACAWAMSKQHIFAAYALGCTGLSVALIAFSFQVSPAMAKQAPGLDYIQIIKRDHKAKIALHSDFAKTIDWVDGTLFETDRVPIVLNGVGDMMDFLSQKETAYVIVPQTRFNKIPEPMHSQLQVVQNRPYMYEKIDVPFLLKRKGRLTGSVPLLLVRNHE